MAAKPNIPVSRKEMYLDVATGGSTELPSPVTLEEKYLAKIAGMTVDLPVPVPLKHKFLAKIAGMQIDVPTYTTSLPRIYAYLAKAAGQDVEIPQPVTREEMYWFDYCGGTPTPPEREYTGAVPVTFTADGTPLLDYLISGNTVQSGTPTPQSPIIPQGTGERTGNLFDAETAYGNMYNDGVITGQAGVINNIKNQVSADMVGKTYTLSFTPLQIASRAYVAIVINGTSHWRENEIFVNQRASFIFTPETANDTWYISYDTGGVCSYEDFMLNSGSTPLPYEPYGYKIPISSANTTTPVYLGEVQTTRKIKKLVLTGNEQGWTQYRTGAALTLLSMKNNMRTTGRCSHFTATYSPSTETGDAVCYGASNNLIYLLFSDSTASALNITNLDSIKQWLRNEHSRGTPVTVWYVLATEETAVVNEPLMKIGDYSDTLSMEQAGAEIPTINGENTLDVLTAVKPSEVYIKYKGEPVAGSQTSSLSSAYAPAEVSSQSESIDDINSSLLGKEEET